VQGEIRHGVLAGLGLLAVLSLSTVARAQQAPPEEELPLPPAILRVQTVQNPAQPCVQPPPPVSWKDYTGPFSKVMGIFGQKIERMSVRTPRAPRYKPNAVLCSLETKEKFILYLQDTVDPATFLAAGFNAGISQATNGDAPFGQGGAGYGRRFGASYADQVQYRFFKEFAYPTLFSEDPRYYREGQGPTGKRILHALGHSVIAYRDSGHRMFNFSELLGNVSGVTLGNVYHPGARRGFGPAAGNVGLDYGLDAGYDVAREFWPELAKKFHLPFRYEKEEISTRNR
jgi:hypothetical protein